MPIFTYLEDITEKKFFSTLFTTSRHASYQSLSRFGDYVEKKVHFIYVFLKYFEAIANLKVIESYELKLE